MFEPKNVARKTDRPLIPPTQSSPVPAPKQQHLMVTSLILLIVALVFVLYRDRDFWFPDAPEAEEQPQPTTPADPASVAKQARPTVSDHKKTHARALHSNTTAASENPPAPAPGFATTARTVLPPLEVEVVAGSTHRTMRPGSNSVDVNTQSVSPRQQASEARADDRRPTTASVTNDAAERVHVSADTGDVVTLSVKPSYPLLARQMKVQGSVILQALVGRNGQIEDLRVITGPPILASAAREAVRQWHFKPHYEGAEAVETETKITVNFTISTN